MSTMNYIDFRQFDSLVAVADYFDTAEICRETLYQARWGMEGAVCPFCGGRHIYRRGNGRLQCAHCRKSFSVTVGTIFDHSKISLRKWFLAMYLISSHKKGISSRQLARDIVVSQKTAWYMLQKIRTLYKQDDAVPYKGTVECDEVYIGGKEKWKHKSMRTPNTQGRSTKTKTPVFGMAERSFIINKKGKKEPMTYVRAIVVPKTDRATLQPAIEQFIEDGSHVITDELNAYNGLENLGYRHSVVCHGEEQFTSGSVSTNHIEGFWCHFRRMIAGCYHNVTDEHLQEYIDEACFRWNTRKMDESQRFAHMFEMSIGIVRYDDIRKGCAA